MKKNNIIVSLMLALIFVFFSNMIVLADIDTIVVCSPQSDKYYQYDLKDILNSYRKYMRRGDKDLFYREFLERINKNTIVFMHDDSGKYISYKYVCEAAHNKKVAGEIFEIDEYAKIAKSAKAPEYVYDRIVKDEKVVSRLNITRDNFSKELNLKNSKESESFEDIRITGNNVTISNGKILGRLIIDPGINGSAYVKNVQAKEIKVLSGGEDSIHLFNVNSEKLEIESDSRVRVESKGETYIGNTLVRTYAILDDVSGTYGEVIISINEEKASNKIQTVELRGVFTEPIIVESDVILKANKDAVIPKVVIAPKNKNAAIKLSGNFRQINIDKKAKVNLEKVEAYKIVINSNAELNMDKNSKIKRLHKNGNKVTVKGEGKTNISKTYEKDASDDDQEEKTKYSSDDDDDDDDDDTEINKPVKVKSIDIIEEKVTLEQGESKKLTAKVTYSDNTSDNKVIWESSDESIATVKDGVVTAATDKEGTVVIKATATKGGVTKTDECKVTVNDTDPDKVKVESVDIVEEKVSLKQGESKKLTVKVTYSDNTSDNKVIWESSDESIATVKDGVVTAATYKEGTVVIKATATKGGVTKTDECEVTVNDTDPDKVKVESVDIIEEKVTLKQGESKKLTAKVTYSDNTSDSNVTWESSDESIATVKDGVVTAASNKAGTVIIKATATKGGVTKTDECKVIVVDKNKIVQVIPDGNRVTFKINDKAVENRIITIRIFNKLTDSLVDVEQKQAKNGYCEFEMKFDAGTYYARINIVGLQEVEVDEFHIAPDKVKVESVDILEEKVTLKQGESKKLTVKVTYSDNTSDNKVIWESSDESIATVKDGVVTAASDKTGTVIIKATAGKGGVTKTDECEVTVNDTEPDKVKVESVDIVEEKVSLEQGESKKLTAKVAYSDNTSDNKVIWESSDESIATVKDGLVTAATDKEGTVIIKATATKGGVTKTDECEVIVVDKNKSVQVIPDGNRVTFKINDKAVENRITTIRIFNKLTGSLEDVQQKEAKDGYCEFEMKFDAGTYYARINIVGLEEVEVDEFHIAHDIVKVIPDGNRVTFRINDKAVENRITTIRIFNKLTGSLVDTEQKQAKESYCEFEMKLDAGTYYARINIVGLEEVEVDKFTINE
jgi:uncharacterized protein YjdB